MPNQNLVKRLHPITFIMIVTINEFKMEQHNNVLINLIPQITIITCHKLTKYIVGNGTLQ